MLALSAAAHVALAIAALVVLPLFGTPLRLEPVAVVDLIGGGEFRQEARKPPEPAPPAGEDVKPAPRENDGPAPPRSAKKRRRPLPTTPSRRSGAPPTRRR